MSPDSRCGSSGWERDSSPASAAVLRRCVIAACSAASAKSLSARVMRSTPHSPAMSARPARRAMRRRATRSARMRESVLPSAATGPRSSASSASSTLSGPSTRRRRAKAISRTRHWLRNGLLPKTAARRARPAESSASSAAKAASAGSSVRAAASCQRARPVSARSGSPGRGRPCALARKENSCILRRP